MPTNRFPDSVEKRELRRRDHRLIRRFCQSVGLSSGAAYCGMPSVEFLDVREWIDCLSSINAVEYDPDVMNDMVLQWDVFDLTVPITFQKADILATLTTATECHDVYNCDFYGGFIYKSTNHAKQPRSKCTEAVRALVERHRRAQRSFMLITTFNVRDTGADEYRGFMDQVCTALGSTPSAVRCCDEHRKSRARELKLCFPFFCWHVGSAANFDVITREVFVYSTSATLVHFVVEFVYQTNALPNLNFIDRLKQVAIAPLKRLDGLVPKVEFAPTSLDQ